MSLSMPAWGAFARGDPMQARRGGPGRAGAGQASRSGLGGRRGATCGDPMWGGAHLHVLPALLQLHGTRPGVPHPFHVRLRSPAARPAICAAPSPCDRRRGSGPRGGRGLEGMRRGRTNGPVYGPAWGAARGACLPRRRAAPRPRARRPPHAPPRAPPPPGPHPSRGSRQPRAAQLPLPAPTAAMRRVFAPQGAARAPACGARPDRVLWGHRGPARAPPAGGRPWAFHCPLPARPQPGHSPKAASASAYRRGQGGRVGAGGEPAHG
jgi:hypothetical protein